MEDRNRSGLVCGQRLALSVVEIAVLDMWEDSGEKTGLLLWKAE